MILKTWSNFMKTPVSAFCILLGSTFLLASEFFASNDIEPARVRSDVQQPTSTAALKSVRLLKVIPQSAAESRLVLRLNTNDVLVKGRSTIDLLCGDCNAVLAEGIASGQLTNLVLFCNHCGSFNDVEDCTPSGSGWSGSDFRQR
jgi:hypothetical protein